MISNFENKKVLVRVDFNVPLNSDFAITDDTRIRAALPTIQTILKSGGAVILMSHLGRPQKKKKEDGSIDVARFTLKHIVAHLSAKLGVDVQFCPETVGAKATQMAAKLEAGQVLLLENTRFSPDEKNGDAAFAKQMAELADCYINDAFGTAHRAHASTAVVAQYFDADAKSFGLLMEAEIKNANRFLHESEKPVTAIVGGAKVSDKILLLEKLLKSVDNLIIGGGMAYTFFKAQGGSVGNSLVEADKMDTALNLLKLAKEQNVAVYLPADSIIADDFNNNANIQTADNTSIADGWMGLDIGPKAVEQFSTVIANSKSILWNGPMGVFEMENFANGTKKVAEAIAATTKNGAFSLIGGGDSVAAINMMQLADQVSYVSTGGGAMLEFLEGKELPGIASINA